MRCNAAANCRRFLLDVMALLLHVLQPPPRVLDTAGEVCGGGGCGGGEGGGGQRKGRKSREWKAATAGRCGGEVRERVCESLL